MLNENLSKTSTRKQISANLQQSTVDGLDAVAKGFSMVTNKFVPRQKIAESAIEAYIENAEKLLKEEYGIDINQLIQEPIKQRGRKTKV